MSQSEGLNFARYHTGLVVYKRAFAATMKIFHRTKQFPREERYSLVDQIRRASRSVCSNIAEAWRKRRYEAAFVRKLCDSEGEAAETQTWIQFSVACDYLNTQEGQDLHKEYDEILSMLVSMIGNSGSWVLK